MHVVELALYHFDVVEVCTYMNIVQGTLYEVALLVHRTSYLESTRVLSVKRLSVESTIFAKNRSSLEGGGEWRVS